MAASCPVSLSHCSAKDDSFPVHLCQCLVLPLALSFDNVVIESGLLFIPHPQPLYTSQVEHMLAYGFVTHHTRKQKQKPKI